MELYFTNIKAKGFRGKPRTTLPKVLNEDLNAYYNKDPIKAELELQLEPSGEEVELQ